MGNASTLPYDIGSPVEYKNKLNLTLHDGSKKVWFAFTKSSK
jgi:hypothetical protein